MRTLGPFLFLGSAVQEATGSRREACGGVGAPSGPTLRRCPVGPLLLVDHRLLDFILLLVPPILSPHSVLPLVQHPIYVSVYSCCWPRRSLGRRAGRTGKCLCRCKKDIAICSASGSSCGTIASVPSLLSMKERSGYRCHRHWSASGEDSTFGRGRGGKAHYH